MRERLLSLLLALAALLGACGVGPQPNPPTLRPSTVMLLPSAMPDVVEVVGSPGTIDPAGAEVQVINLSRFAVSATTMSAPDGSFSVLVPGVPEDRFRVQVIEDTLRSETADVVGPPGGGPAMEPGSALACLTMTPADFVDLGEVSVGDVGVATITLVNGCGTDVMVDGATPLMGMGFINVITGMPPVIIPPDGERNLVITYTPLAPMEEVVEVVEILVSAPMPEPLYVSVFARSVP